MWYSYAVVRVVPRVERGEFLNAGIVVFSPEFPFLGAQTELDRRRLLALAPHVDVEVVARHLTIFEAICAGDPAGGALAELPPSERFYWLVAPRSTVIQTSPVHVGQTADPRQTLNELMQRLVRSPQAACEGA